MKDNFSILIVEDDKQTLSLYSLMLRKNGIKNLIMLSDGIEVMDILKKNDIEVILLDLSLPSLDGMELLPIIKREYPDIPIVVVTGTDKVSVAVECMRAGAFDYIVKPVDQIRLVTTVRRAIEMTRTKRENKRLKKRFLENRVRNLEVFSHIITNDPKMRAVFIYLESITVTREPILIMGETGTGKELIADAIHKLSGLEGEYIKVNVSGLDDTIFADTLFGHLKGSFTGALASRKGLVERAKHGTLFLDEIGDLSLVSQTKLLRLIENGEYFSIGSDKLKIAETRIIVATNKNLEKLVEQGSFRKDLYYRLSSHQVALPPLRERRGDISLLIDFFVEKASKDLGVRVNSISSSLYDCLVMYDFPGNIRELRSIIYDTVSQCRDGFLTENNLKGLKIKRDKIKGTSNNDIESENLIVFTTRFPKLKEAIEITINEALKRTKNQLQAARLLGISPAALSKRLKARKENQHR